jgi:hypothetical protein
MTQLFLRLSIQAQKKNLFIKPVQKEIVRLAADGWTIMLTKKTDCKKLHKRQQATTTVTIYAELQHELLFRVVRIVLLEKKL